MADFAAPTNAAAMGDLFAPPDRAAAQAWQDRKFNVNAGNIDQTRMKVGFNTGNPGGMVDPQALKVMSQGGPYDFNARRNAIAATVQQQAAAPAAAATPTQGTANAVDASGGTYQIPLVGIDAAGTPYALPPRDDSYNYYAYGGSA